MAWAVEEGLYPANPNVCFPVARPPNGIVDFEKWRPIPIPSSSFLYPFFFYVTPSLTYNFSFYFPSFLLRFVYSFSCISLTVGYPPDWESRIRWLEQEIVIAIIEKRIISVAVRVIACPVCKLKANSEKLERIYIDLRSSIGYTDFFSSNIKTRLSRTKRYLFVFSF